MAVLTESVLVDASLAEVWSLYFDRRSWPAWVEGFRSVESADRYPEQGGTLVWRSNPAGRGTVHERVIEHRLRRHHEIEYSDPESAGRLRTEFAIEGEATRVALRLDYRLARSGPLTWIVERLFVRAQVRGSLRRALLRFKHEVEEIARLGQVGRADL